MIAPTSPTAPQAPAPGLDPAILTTSNASTNLPLVLPGEISDYETLMDNWVAKKSTAFRSAVLAIAPAGTGGGGTTDPGTGGGTTTPATSQTPTSITNSTTRRAAVPDTATVTQNVTRPTTNSLAFQSSNGSTGSAQFPVVFNPGKVVDVVWEAPGFGTGLQPGSGAIQLSMVSGPQTEGQAAANGVSMGQNDANGRLIFRNGVDYYASPFVPNTPNLRMCFYGQANTAGVLPYYSLDGGATWKSDFLKNDVTPLQPIVLTGTLYLSFFSQAAQTLSQNITVGVDAAINGVLGSGAATNTTTSSYAGGTYNNTTY
jgi:hypothetical protein